MTSIQPQKRIVINPLTGKLELASKNNFSYTFVDTDQVLNIRASQQMIVHEDIIIDGELIVDGILIVEA